MKAFYKQYDIESHPTTEMKTARLATEFQASNLYEFPQGAYSTVDAILERSYPRDPNLTILLNTEVISVNSGEDGKATSIDVYSNASSQVRRLRARKGVVLCATLGTAAVALNSGMQQKVPLVGKGLNDHEIWGVRFLKLKIGSEELSPMKLRCEVIVTGVPAMLNVAINANNLLGRKITETEMPTQIFASAK